jgi:formate-dependent nitrite reductase membrane component NrfD
MDKPSNMPKPLPGSIEEAWLLKQKGRKERRRGKDALLVLLSVIGYINGALIIATAVIFTLAKPDTFHSMYGGLPLKYYWDQDVLNNLFYISISGLLISTIGLLINSRRLKRKTDSIRYHLVVVAVLSIGGIVFFLVRS